MKLIILVTLSTLTLTGSALADTWCTIKARNTALHKHQDATEKSGITLADCVTLASKEFGRSPFRKVQAGSFDVNLVLYSFQDGDTRSESTMVIEGKIEDPKTESEQTIDDPTGTNTTPAVTTTSSRQPSERRRIDRRCGNDDQR